MPERRYVVLDLFIVHAITTEDDIMYLRTASLLHKIIDNCHKIVLTPSLSREYKTRLKQLEKRGYTNDRLFKIIKMLLSDTDKVVEKEDLTYDIPVRIPEDDKMLVKAAVAAGGSTIIVTTNREHFIENLELKEYLRSQKLNIEILSLEEALHKL